MTKHDTTGNLNRNLNTTRTFGRSRAAGLFGRWSLAVYLLVVAIQSLVQVFYINADQNVRYAGITGTDGQAYYAFLRSVWIDGDLDFENEFYAYNYNQHGFQTPDFFPRSPITGLYFNRFPIGFALFLSPFFLLAHLATLFANAAGFGRLNPDGYSVLYQFAPPVGALFYGACAYWTTQRILMRFFSRGTAAWTTFVTFLSYQGSFAIIIFWCNPHLQSFFIFNVLLLLAFQVEEGKDGAWVWAGLGALVGLLGLLRTEMILSALLPFLLFCQRGRVLWRDAEPANRRALLGKLALRATAAPIACILVFSPQLIVWRLLWGEWFLLWGERFQMAMSNPDATFHWPGPVFWKILFSTRGGLFYWSPVLLIGFAGLMLFAGSKRAGTTIRLSLMLLFVFYFFYASWTIWWMGHAFGARQFIGITALFAIGAGFLVERFQHRPVWIAGVSLCLIAWNTAMLWMFLNGHIPRSEGFPWQLPFVKLFELLTRGFA